VFGRLPDPRFRIRTDANVFGWYPACFYLQLMRKKEPYSDGWLWTGGAWHCHPSVEKFKQLRPNIEKSVTKVKKSTHADGLGRPGIRMPHAAWP
jgi:hypothetical protein